MWSFILKSINFPCAEILCGFSLISLCISLSVYFFLLPTETRKTETKCIDFHLEEGGLLKPLALWRREYLRENSVHQNTASIKASTSNEILATLETHSSLTLSLNNLFSVWASAWNEAFITLMGLGCYTEDREAMVWWFSLQNIKSQDKFSLARHTYTYRTAR